MKYGLQFTATKTPNAKWHHDAVEDSNDEHLKMLMVHYMDIVDPNGTGPMRMKILSKSDTELISVTWHDFADKATAEELIVMWSASFPDPLFQEYMAWKREYHTKNNIRVSYSSVAVSEDGKVISNPTAESYFVAHIS